RVAIDVSPVTASGGASDVTVGATTENTIKTVAVAASVSVSASSGTVALSGSGAGASAINTTTNEVLAEIVGSTVEAGRAVSVTLSDHSVIEAKIVAAAVGVSASSGVSLSGVVAITIATNSIGGVYGATIFDSDVNALAGGVTVSATADNSIDAIAVAVAISVALGSSFAGSVAVAGVVAENILTNSLTAGIVSGSNIGAHGLVGVSATDTSSIKATLVSVAASISVSGSASVAFSISATVANNQIGSTLKATIDDSAVDTTGAVSVEARADTLISATAAAVSVSVAVSGGVSISGAGSGAYAANSTTNSVEASIIGSSITAVGDVDVLATDISRISATLVSAAVGVSGGSGLAVSVSVAVTLAENTIDSALLATIDDSTVGTSAGAVTVAATNYDDALARGMGITATAVAAAISAGGSGGVSVQGAGTGAVAINSIGTGTEASIVDSAVTAHGTVSVAATDEARIKAVLVAASIGAGGAGAVSVNVAISATVAENTIGGGLLATIDGSTVNTTDGAVTVDAIADRTIEALGVAVGVAAGGAGAVSVNVALSAVVATNIIAGATEASIKGGSDVDANHASNGFVRVNALDTSSIEATLASASVTAGGAGAVSVNVAGAFVYADNALSASTDFDWNADGVIDFHDIHAGLAVLTALHDLQIGNDGVIGDQPGPDGDPDTLGDNVPSDDLTVDQAIDALGNLSVFAAGQPSAAYKTALKSLIGSSFDIDGDGNITNRDLLLTGSTSDDVVIANSMVASIETSSVDTA
ncbi:hypothetical protein EOD07_31295, partial [Mesorhizobium sp. M2C.T.Ca.TU.002.02.1.1]